MHLKSVFLVLYLSIISFSLTFAQSNVNKNAGIAFRVDDSHSALDFSQYANVFRKYGLNFTFGLNLSANHMASYPSLADTTRVLINEGNEMADHTPNHTTKLFTVANTAPYVGKAGVDHIITSSNTICLAYDQVKTTTYTGEGLINVRGDKVISINNGEFQIMGDLNAIYFNNTLYTYDPADIITSSSKPDTILNLKNFWGQSVDLGNLDNISYDKVGSYDVHMSIDALKLLGQATLDQCTLYNLPFPRCWLQPGGDFPQLWKADIALAMGSLGYTSGAVYPDAVGKFFNEYDPGHNNSFAMEWGDFMEDKTTLATVKKIIADRTAQHQVSVGHSHFWDLLGGWAGYLNRTDSILAWCKANNIPVRTYSQWKDILYNTPQNPYVNIMPRLDVDLDNDSLPDGYTLHGGTTVDKSDYPVPANKWSLVQTGPSDIFSIDYLGGIEKGKNYFSFYAKGQPNSTISVAFWIRVGSSGVWQGNKFILTSTDWQKFEMKDAIHGSKQLIIPDSAYSMKLTMLCSDYASGSSYIKIGGFELRKFTESTIVPPFMDKPVFTNNLNNIKWEINSSNQTQFILKRKYSGQASYQTVAALGTDIYSYKDSLLDLPDSLKRYDSVTVIYKVIAANGSVSSESNIDSIRVPTASILPVELQNFTASLQDKKVVLKWETATEVSNYGFNIEKNTAGIWKNIGFVKGSGNSNSNKKYLFADNNLLGGNKFLYRLKQIDLDGKFTYSNSIEVNFIPKIFALSQNYPNPFNPSTTIEYSIPNPGIVSLKLYNILGEEVAQLVNEYKEPGYYKYGFANNNSRMLSSGVYFYVLKSGSSVVTKKMMLLK